MTTIKRFTPDYAMHSARFEAFAREAEHGEYVRFDAHQQKVSALEAERDAQQKRADALEVRLRNALSSEQEAIQRAHAANQAADDLAVENRELKKFGDKLNEMHNNLNGEGTGIQGRAEVVCQQAAIEAAMDEFDAITTPATSAALAAIRNEATARALKHLCECQIISATVAELKADELREAK